MITRSFFKRLLRSVAAPVDSARSAERRAREAIALCHALLSQRGEVSGAALARDALAAYMRGCAEFGLTAAARTRVKIRPPGEDDEDDLLDRPRSAKA